MEFFSDISAKVASKQQQFHPQNKAIAERE
jgi:hypothetical protein